MPRKVQPHVDPVIATRPDPEPDEIRWDRFTSETGDFTMGTHAGEAEVVADYRARTARPPAGETPEEQAVRVRGNRLASR